MLILLSIQIITILVLFLFNPPLYLLEIFLFVAYTTSIFIGYNFFRKQPLFLIVAGTFGFFIYSRFLLDVFGFLPFDFKWATRFIGYSFSYDTMAKTLIAYSLSSLFFSLGFVLYNYLNKHKQIKIQNSRIFENIGFFLIIISLPGITFKFFLLIKIVLENGYLGLFIGKEYGVLARTIEFVSFKIFIVGLSFYLSSILTTKKFMFIATLMLMVAIVYITIGQRALFGITILFLFWYWYSYIHKYLKINPKKIFMVLFAGLLIIYLFGYIGSLREGKEFTDSHPIRNTLIHQGASGLVLPYYIGNEKEMNKDNSLYLLDPIINKWKIRSNSYDTLNKRDYFGYELTYLLDARAYLQGEGMGTSYIAELYEFGLIGVVIGMFLLGIFVGFFEQHKHILIFKLMSWITVSTLVFLPRSELFELFYEFVLILLLYIILMSFKQNHHSNKLLQQK